MEVKTKKKQSFEVLYVKERKKEKNKRQHAIEVNQIDLALTLETTVASELRPPMKNYKLTPKIFTNF
jgi:hypothetical protein